MEQCGTLKVQGESMISTWKAVVICVGFIVIGLFSSKTDAAPVTLEPVGDPKQGEIWKDPQTNMEFVWISGGCYQMGCDQQQQADCDEDEFPAHEVCVSGFWMGKVEVTQTQWEEIMLDNPSRVQPGPNYPVENVSWHDVKKFIADLMQANDNRYIFRLPTEAEWEYACRSGGQSKPFAGSYLGKAVGWFWNADETNKISFPVGQKPANDLGLFDMSGNVWEWVEDVYDTEAYAKHRHNDPLVSDGGSCRVTRGGSFHSFSKRGRCGNRRAYAGITRGRYVGFRLVRDRVPEKPPTTFPPVLESPVP